MFEGVTAVIFVTAISDYGSKCFEVCETRSSPVGLV